MKKILFLNAKFLYISTNACALHLQVNMDMYPYKHIFSLRFVSLCIFIPTGYNAELQPMYACPFIILFHCQGKLKKNYCGLLG